MTLPRMRTVWLVKDSRYLAFIRGVASEAMIKKAEGAFWLMEGELALDDGKVEQGTRTRLGLSRCHVIAAASCFIKRSGAPASPHRSLF